MLAQITWPQFLEWLAYDQLEPFGEEREDMRNAHIVQTLINLHRSKNQEPYPLSRFVLTFGDYKPPPPPQQDWRSMKSMMAAMLGAPLPGTE